jgi:hypothetical protein
MEINKIKKLLIILYLLSITLNINAARYMENLDRGVVAVWMGSNRVWVSWRMLGTDPSNVGFNVYRNGTKINSSVITSVTYYIDTAGSQTASYYIRPVINGVEQAASKSVTPWANFYKRINLRRPSGGTTPDGVSYTYSPNDCSVGDLDGDGEYEIVVKWDPSNSKDNSQSGYTGNVYLDAYKLDGTFMWRIDLGINIRAGAHYTQFMVYDLDSDGKAEIACKTAPGTRDGTGTYLHTGPAGSDNDSADYRNSSGYILTGPEYLTVFRGTNGAEIVTVNYVPARGTVSSWGDSYGNRVDRFLACVAYLDGVHPSLVMQRGYYTRMVLAAWDFNGSSLTQRWVFDSNNSGYSSYAGQGNHNLSVGDVDGDGKDEIIEGACAIDDNGAGMYVTGLGHGDAMHLGDLNPDRSGLEVWEVHESTSASYGYEMHDARTGQIIWGANTGTDNGRGLAADIDSRYRGYEMWSASGTGVYSCTGTQISTSKPTINFRIYWDGDLLDEILDGTVIDKWNGNGTTRVLTGYNYETASAINGTKNTPCLSADILGDWREELILRTSDNTALVIFTTTTETNFRMYTLMHDPQYRLSIAWQNVAYNQPPHLGFYLYDGNPPTPDIILVGGGTPTPVMTATRTPTFTRTPTYTATPYGYARIEGENACFIDGVIESTNGGYEGSGYANLNNVVGSTIMFSFNATVATNINLTIRYANGSSNNRNMEVYRNGILIVNNVDFPSTGAWTTWTTQQVNINLLQGYNEIVFRSLTSEGGPNIDYISWISSNVTNGNCVSPTATRTGTATRTNTMQPTNTFTRTRTITPTWTRTVTGTATRTSSPTATASSTYTPTRTNTRTATMTQTRTSSPTLTRTATGTATRTNTMQSTNTFTGTRTITPTWTRTATGTATRTNTVQPTNTFTGTRTATPTWTRTATGTATRTNTVQPTNTFTGTRTATPTWTRTATGTATRTNTVQPTNTFTGTRTATVTVTGSQVASATRTATVTVTGSQVPSITSTRTVTQTITTTSSPTYTITATRTNSPSFTQTATSSQQPTITMTSSQQPTMTATPTATKTQISKQQPAIDKIVLYPNPYKQGDLKIGFNITQDMKIIKVRIYTSGFRLIKQITMEGEYRAGENTINIESRYLDRLANGIYYVLLVGKNREAIEERSRPVELVILR